MGAVSVDWGRVMQYGEAEEGAWRMPWLTEAMKDVISCDKPGVGANGH